MRIFNVLIILVSMVIITNLNKGNKTSYVYEDLPKYERVSIHYETFQTKIKQINENINDYPYYNTTVYTYKFDNDVNMAYKNKQKKQAMKMFRILRFLTTGIR